MLRTAAKNFDISVSAALPHRQRHLAPQLAPLTSRRSAPARRVALPGITWSCPDFVDTMIGLHDQAERSPRGGRDTTSVQRGVQARGGLAFEGNQPVSQVARELDVRPDMQRRWRRLLSGEGAKPSAEEQR